MPLIDERHGIVALGAAFGRDSRRVYFSQKPRAAVRPFSEIGEYQLASVDRDSGRIFPESTAVGGGLRPALSPDGRWLVYGSRHHAETGLRLRDLSNGEESWLGYPATHDEQESQHVSWDLMPGYAFTPDSSAIVVAMAGRISRVEVPSGRVTPIPFEAEVRLELAPLLRAQPGVDAEPNFRAREVLSLALAPDGRRLAFSAGGQLWTLGMQDLQIRGLTRGPAGGFDPAWSRDGRSLVYATWEESGGHIYRVAAAGGAARRLTRDAALYLWPAYSPRGDEIVALRMSRQAWADLRVSRGMDLAPRSGPRIDLVSVPAAGGATRVIATLHAIQRPHFGPEADRVYVYQPRGFASSGGEGLVSIGLDGTDLRSHARVSIRRGANVDPAEDVQISPDGKALLVWADQHVFRAALPADGAVPHALTIGEDSAGGIVRLSAFGGDSPAWTTDGKAVFSLGATIFVADAAGVSPAREIPVPLRLSRPMAQGTLALRGARLITLRGGAQDVVEQGTIVVRDGRILEVGPMAGVRIPAGATVIDATGSVIVPGFIDSHAHFNTIQATRPAQPWEFLTVLAYGVTTVFDPSGRPALMTHADMVESGRLLGPRIYTSGLPVDVDAMASIRDLDSMRALMSRYGRYYGHHIVKYYASGNRLQRQWMATAARELGMMIAAEGNGENRIAIPQILDGFSGHEHYLTMRPLYRDVVELIARSGTWYTPTLLVTHGSPGGEETFYATRDVHDDARLARFTPHPLFDRETRRRDQYWQHWMHPEEYPAPKLARGVADVRAAGGRVGVGGHGQRQGLGMQWEMQLLARGGMPNREILRAATLGGAENLGLARDLGSLEPGKRADLVVLGGDPLRDIRATESIRQVMKDGRLLDGATLDEVWPKAVNRQNWRYWGADPAPATPTEESR